tara:strand:+ start:2946 stop:3209 length:264 start_codon:yes stop_codon:yes gene_type:complete
MGIMNSSGSAKAPHVALITMNIRIHELLESGDVNPKFLSKEELDKFGVTEKAILRVDGFDKFDCVKKMIELFQKLGADGCVEGVKDV